MNRSSGVKLLREAVTYFFRHPSLFLFDATKHASYIVEILKHQRSRTGSYSLQATSLVELVREVAPFTSDDLCLVIRELERQEELNKYIDRASSFAQKLPWSSLPLDRCTGSALYALCRVGRPKVVVETGVALGISSAYILCALENNDQGTLYSIDLPSGKIITGVAVPLSLKKRWVLLYGKSRDKLPSLLKDLGKIDLFLHDSLHTYENMFWEFATAWQYLRKGGLLLSCDVRKNNAFLDFSDQVKSRPLILKGTDFGCVVRV